MPGRKHLILVAGEASGDMHAAHLVDHIKSLNPAITFSGLGGPQMRKSGVELYADLTKLAVVGFIEVIKHFNEIKRLFYLIIDKVQETKADAVILIDYPGFNLRLAQKLKEKGVKVIYYISPQVWAWKENRVKLISRVTDKMLVLFLFEKDFYARHHVNVDFVGHPLIDTINVTQSREAFLSALGLTTEKITIGLLPGSREKEIERLLPVMLAAGSLLFKKNPRLQFIIPQAPTLKSGMIEQILKGYTLPVKIVDQQTYNAINASAACIVASGTATLETAILQKPMVIVYKTSLLSWLLAKMFVKIPDIGMVNVVAGKRIVPECVQFEATPERIADELEEILSDETRIATIKSDLSKVKAALGESHASRRAAQEVLKVL